MERIDIDYNFREDSKSGDPDKDSKKLYCLHETLWNKLLPSGKELKLEVTNKGRLILKNTQCMNLSSQCMNLSSDRMCPPYPDIGEGLVAKFGAKKIGFNAKDVKSFNYKVRTIGGYIVFPAHQVDGKPTINQARGWGERKTIGDRFDLTLECIRRFYNDKEYKSSPLLATLTRYQGYFDLFESFEGYIDFFLLQDFVDNEYQVKFALPFDDFKGSPFPKDADDADDPEEAAEYKRYMDKTMELINNRNIRISEYLKELG